MPTQSTVVAADARQSKTVLQMLTSSHGIKISSCTTLCIYILKKSQELDLEMHVDTLKIFIG